MSRRFESRPNFGAVNKSRLTETDRKAAAGAEEILRQLKFRTSREILDKQASGGTSSRDSGNRGENALSDEAKKIVAELQQLPFVKSIDFLSNHPFGAELAVTSVTDRTVYVKLVTYNQFRPFLEQFKVADALKSSELIKHRIVIIKIHDKKYPPARNFQFFARKIDSSFFPENS